MHRASRAISTIIGAAIVILIFIAFVAFVFISMQYIKRLTELSARILSVRSEEAGISNAITGWWLAQGTNVIINITSSYPRALLLTSITIVFANGSYFIASSINGSIKAKVEISTPSASYSLNSLSLPFGLGAGYSVEITFSGIASPSYPPRMVSVTISASPVVVAIPLKNYRQLYQSMNYSYTLKNTPFLYEPYTSTWAGTALVPSKSTITGNVVSVNVVSGVLVNGTADSLELYDGNTMVINAVRQPAIFLVKRSAVYWNDFANLQSASLNPINGTWVVVSESYDPYGGSINQTDTTVGEAIALAPVRLGNGRYYILVDTYRYTLGYIDIVLYRNDSAFYTLGIVDNQTRWLFWVIRREYADIWLYLNGWSLLSSAGPVSPTIGSWMRYLAIYDTSTGYMNITEIDPSTGAARISTYTINTTVQPAYIGIGTYRSAALFDQLIITVNASPFYINVTGLPVGTAVTVSIVDKNGDTINTTTTTTGTAVLDVSNRTIIEGAKFLITIGNTTYTIPAPNGFALGGDVYRFTWVYKVDIEDSQQLDLTAVLGFSNLRAAIVFTANITVNASLSAYDWNLGAFTDVASWSSVQGVVDTVVLDASRYLQGGTGLLSNTSLKLTLYSDKPFNVSIDQLNTEVTAYANPTPKNVLLIARPGSKYIDVYSLPDLSYMFSIDTRTTLGKYAAFTVNGSTLYLVNATGIYKGFIAPRTTWSPVTTSCAVSNTTPVARLEIAKNVLISVVSATQLCIYDTTTSTSRTLPLPSGYSFINYTSSASDGSAAFFTAVNGSGYPLLLKYSPASGLSAVMVLPGRNTVGLDVYSGYIWTALAGGGVYKIDPTTKTVIQVPVSIPAIPLNPGDRLETMGTYLVLIRADYTNEIYKIAIS